MKFSGKLFVLTASLLGVILCSGCISTEYTGREYPPTKVGEITYYDSVKDVPELKLAMIGRCVLTAPVKYSGEDLKDAAMAKAAEVGADAVAYYDFKKYETGQVTLPANSNRNQGDVSGKFDFAGRTSDNSPIYTDSFGRTSSSLKTATKPVYELRLRVLFYRDRAKGVTEPIVTDAKPAVADKVAVAPTTEPAVADKAAATPATEPAK